MTQRWVRVGKAAQALGVCDETVYRLAKARKIAYRRDEDTGSWRFDLLSIEAYLRVRTVPAQLVTPAIAAVAMSLPRNVEPWRPRNRGSVAR